jgi:molecular chaperone GrpE
MNRTPDNPGTSSGVPGGESVADAATRAASAPDPTSGSPDEPIDDAASAPPDTALKDGERPHGDPLGDAAQDEAPSSEPRLEANGNDESAGRDHEQVERDLEELTAKADKADEYLVLAQRTKADFENYRKRAAREASLAQDRGVAKLAKELLPAIDNLNRAVQAAETFAAGSPEEAAAEAESQLASGIKLVHADVLAALARVGIEPYSPAGEQFDPQFHEAVAQHPVEGQAAGTVIEVYQQGYRLGETVLRPARVLVAA